MKRRQRPEDVTVKPFGNFGYGHAFESGDMHGALFGMGPLSDDDVYTLAELRAAWGEYRELFMQRRDDRSVEGTSWAELVFDEGIGPDKARAVVEARRGK